MEEAEVTLHKGEAFWSLDWKVYDASSSISFLYQDKIEKNNGYNETIVTSRLYQ